MTTAVAKPTLNGNRASHKGTTASLTKAELRAIKRAQRKHKSR